MDSDELLPSQDEEEDGLALSDTDSLLGGGIEKEALTVTITAEKFKRVLKSARRKVISANKEAVLAQKRKAEQRLAEELKEQEVPLTVEQAIEQAQTELQAEKKEFRRLYDGLDKKTGAFDRLVKYRKRLDKDVEYFVRDLQKFKNLSPLDK